MRRLFGRTCLLDTNVLVYSLDRTSAYFVQAAQVLEHCTNGQITGYLSQQILLELLHVLTRYQRVPLADALHDVTAFADHPRLPIVGPSTYTYKECLRLARSASNVDVFDLYLVATMIDAGITTLVTANTRDFRDVAGAAGVDVIDLRSLSV
jgi:predicted nucleic acid-binding protein